MRATEAKLLEFLRNVELGLTSLVELPYAIGLVRESLERRIEHGADAG